MMLLILVCLVQLIWKAYFAIARWRTICSYHTFDEPESGGLDVYVNICNSCVKVNVLKNVVLCLAFVRRLVYLTSSVHSVNKQASHV